MQRGNGDMGMLIIKRGNGDVGMMMIKRGSGDVGINEEGKWRG